MIKQRIVKVQFFPVITNLLIDTYLIHGPDISGTYPKYTGYTILIALTYQRKCTESALKSGVRVVFQCTFSALLNGYSGNITSVPLGKYYDTIWLSYTDKE